MRVLGKVARTAGSLHTLLQPVVNHNAHCVVYSNIIMVGTRV